MNGVTVFRRHVRQMRAAQLARYVCYALPVAVLSAFLIARVAGGTLFEACAIALVVAGVQVLAIDLAQARRRVTRRRTAEHLDRTHAVLEDSSMLLLSAPATLTLPARLQRTRTADALDRLHAEGRLTGAATGRVPHAAALSLIVAAALANTTWMVPGWFGQDAALDDGIVAPRIASLSMEARPPAYTRLPPLQFDTGDVSVPEFSTLRLTLRAEGDFEALTILSGAGERVRLYAAGDGRWQSPWWGARATTWQVVDDAGNPVPMPGGGIVHAVALVSDEAPRIHVRAPAARLHEIEGLPFALPVRLAVEDDYGVSSVTAFATRATGSGERVRFEDASELLYESAAAGERSVEAAKVFDGAALGLEPGAEVYLHFEASDGRPGAANVARSQTLILRWRGEDQQPDVVLDNAVVTVMPEYFRSQRQIIIDSEALVAGRDSIDAETFAARAQSLAIDQQALRLRYGQFLGEEVGGEPAALPEGGVEAHFAGDGHDHDGPVEGDGGDGHYAGDGHDHGDETLPRQDSAIGDFGDAAAAIEPYAHFHDREEQATLFDPETRELLRAALRAMWRSEGELRQFRPAPALPHQYEALALIKRVQNRSRVFVARVGFEPTPVDPARRLSGELDEIEPSGGLGPRDAATTDARVIEAMRALRYGALVQEDADVVENWIDGVLDDALRRGDDAASSAALGARAALDQWRIDARCDDCGERLAAFWLRHAPDRPAPAARGEVALDAFVPAERSP